MKYLFPILICAILLVACKNETTKILPTPVAPVEALVEVRATGGLTNFEGFDSFFPIPTGVACYFNPKKKMMMVNFTTGKADISTICGV